ncbi:MAG: 6-carboxytetrahydropterin synthase [Vicinamibacterales bacterium]
MGCSPLHGHSFAVIAKLRGPVGETSGWVVDFAGITAAWQPLEAVLARWVWRQGSSPFRCRARLK